MDTDFKTLSIKTHVIFNDESFSKREAWGWLIDNSVNGKLSCSIRYMATTWKWHRSKVERFIARVKAESLIETEIKTGKLVITICNFKQFITSPTKLETLPATISRQDQDAELVTRQVQDNNEDTKTQENPITQEIDETILSQFQDNEVQKEEKKKRTKKRKEERSLKEKNIPYGDTKKENFVPFQLVQENDVEIWVEQALQAPINLSWELEKFKDYWLSTRKKPPKDGIAAFRNWLRRSLEINGKYGGKIEQFSRNTAEKPTSFERFLAGGARALAKVGEY